MEKIVRRPVLLDDHDDMLETRDLRVSEQSPKEKQQRSSKGDFHPVPGRRSANDLIIVTFLGRKIPKKGFAPEHNGVCF